MQIFTPNSIIIFKENKIGEVTYNSQINLMINAIHRFLRQKIENKNKYVQEAAEPTLLTEYFHAHTTHSRILNRQHMAHHYHYQPTLFDNVKINFNIEFLF